MIICDACRKHIHRYEELCFTADFKQAHAACLANAIRAYLRWRSEAEPPPLMISPLIGSSTS